MEHVSVIKALLKHGHFMTKQPRTQALWFVYVILRTWDGTRWRKTENSAGSAW